MFEVSNWEEARCPDRSNRPPVAPKNAAATAVVPKNTGSNNATIKNVKNTNTKNTKNTNVSHAAAARRAANNTAGV
jgi:hypothetical protein